MSLVSPVSFVRNKAECGVDLQMKVFSEDFTIMERVPTRLKVSMLKTKHTISYELCLHWRPNFMSTYLGLMPV